MSAATVKWTNHHIVIAKNADGEKVTDHPNKKEAMRVGTELRRSGVTAFVHSKEFADKHGLDPRDRPRDENGRFI